MESKNLLIVFVKNIRLGKVKTRLAQTIGDENAFLIYKELVKITENATQQLQDCSIQIYFSDVIIETKWKGYEKFIQKGNDLGEKMQHAFEQGFNSGYEKILLIGSDLPDISASIIKLAFDELANNDIVFGPAEDGGYYLVGMNKLHPAIFQNKPWSNEELLSLTLKELSDYKLQLLPFLNDIDVYEDLIKYPKLMALIEITKNVKYNMDN
ncbi:MAG: glycosyltransferase [Flavobacteriales bacterium CG18_big_fil_WC_8_21_14_2_50_32_9]|nr:glycosyltransferase [Flavobacteriales bacterium]PIQ16826.1 MAG: glycosyltransferase [Flavobacteriales bacterium CG18_big_fil_WC_8_21_14_2_50_32_9]